MMFNINGSSTSLTAQRIFSTNTKALNTSLERLATGRRINRGADDPAGLIASEMLGAVLKGLEAEVRSMQRADNVLNVAEGALGSTSDLLVEANGLAVTAANSAGMSPEERQAIQMQIDSILETVDRTASTTTFNGQPLLDGTATVSAGGASVDIDSASTGNLGEVEIDGETYTLADVGSGGALNLIDGNVEGAQMSIQAAIGQVATARGALGSFQRHGLEAGIANAQTAFINTAAARSQVLDTNYAQETLSLSRSIVFQQASLGAIQMFASMQSSILALLDL
jgi:flagellin-like hook-associated protein FlgL